MSAYDGTGPEEILSVEHLGVRLGGRDVLSEYQVVRDPVKIINGYGYGYCGLLGPVMAGVWALTVKEMTLLCRAARDSGASAVFLPPPIYCDCVPSLLLMLFLKRLLRKARDI